MIEVILREDIPSVGEAGDMVNVKDGFARNFLLPQKKAVIADAGNLKMREMHRQHAQARAAKRRAEAEALAKRVGETTVRIAHAAGPEGKLFGAITATEIAQQLARAQIAVDRRQIRLAEPIRAVGTYHVDVRLHPEVQARITVTVEAK
ncbi:MAG: 50S ribosomal protein L9 [Deltaproteobacteria bacterium]|nr:50S ribosomal protein L9 [Deltaproteobacteria bacterium]